MKEHYTIMLIPEQEKNIISFRLPPILFKSFSFVFVVLIIVTGILAYDYKQILDQVYENKNLAIENRKLRDQLTIFQMKINTLSDDLSRIQTFEKKLRIITGIEKNRFLGAPPPSAPQEIDNWQNEGRQNAGALEKGQNDLLNKSSEIRPSSSSSPDSPLMSEDQKTSPEYKKLKNLYETQLARAFGVNLKNAYGKNTLMTKRSFLLATPFAEFDYKHSLLKKGAEKLEVNIHKIDQFLLDRESFIKSTPTILPTAGWITSYYGPRKSPYSGRMKMHEGIDIGARPGTTILAPADGVVGYAGHKPGFGKLVRIDHGYGIETIFGHAQKTMVRSGEKVKRGMVIAAVGSTGLSTGPHLHYEVRVNGIAVDPLYFILD